MDLTIYPGKLSGTVKVIPSKSQAHRLLICAAFSDAPTTLLCPETNQDIEATKNCLNAMGAEITATETGFHVIPATKIPTHANLPCGESGSTLRFLLPIAGALGICADFLMEGRLPDRPLSPLQEEMERMGCKLTRPEHGILRCSGRLQAGNYTLTGSVSSQFISGLLFALPLIAGQSTLAITGKLESAPYVDLTRQALSLFGYESKHIGYPPFHSPGQVYVEGDWSNGAFFLAAQALGNNIALTGLNPSSVQGDRAAAELIPALKEYQTISCADIPDLVPILSVVAACNQGALFTDVARLRLKESDRIASVSQMLNRLGCQTEVTENTLRVFPGHFRSCTVDACRDHRIAMAAAIAATKASGPVTILGADCVKKSYPEFWNIYRSLGGIYEQYIR